jgi:hypothetical protein
LAQDTSQAAPEAPFSSFGGPDDRIQELTERIEELDARIAGLQGSGPTVLIVVSFIVSPSLLLGPGLLLLADAYDVEGLILPGVAFTALGLSAVAMIFYGFHLRAERKAELRDLTSERNMLQRDVERLKRRRPPAARPSGPPLKPSPTVTVLALAF